MGIYNPTLKIFRTQNLYYWVTTYVQIVIELWGPRMGFGPIYVAHIPPLRGWHSRDSLFYWVGARMAYITSKAKKKDPDSPQLTPIMGDYGGQWILIPPLNPIKAIKVPNETSPKGILDRQAIFQKSQLLRPILQNDLFFRLSKGNSGDGWLWGDYGGWPRGRWIVLPPKGQRTCSQRREPLKDK